MGQKWVQGVAFAVVFLVGATLAIAYSNKVDRGPGDVPATVGLWHSGGGAYASTEAPASPTVAVQPPTTVAPTATLPPAPKPARPMLAPTGIAPPRLDTPSATGDAALSLLHYPVAQLGFQIIFHGPRAGYLGMTYCDTRQVNVYVRPQQTLRQVAYITAWEVAHAVDCNHPERRVQWAALRGFGMGGFWFPPCECREDAYGSGDFAGVFAEWQVGREYSWRSRVAPPPTGRQLQLLLPYLQA